MPQRGDAIQYTERSSTSKHRAHAQQSRTGVTQSRTPAPSQRRYPTRRQHTDQDWEFPLTWREGSRNIRGNTPRFRGLLHIRHHKPPAPHDQRRSGGKPRPQAPENSMSVPVEVLAQQVLQLPAADRARLLDQVISSLDADRARDARWNALAARRDAEADTDPTLLVSGPEAVARVRASLG